MPRDFNAAAFGTKSAAVAAFWPDCLPMVAPKLLRHAGR